MYRKIALILVLSFISLFVSAQEENIVDSTKNVSKETVSFESYYYSALNEKIKGNHVEAVELLRKALRFKPTSADAQYELSINYKSLKDYNSAIVFGENAIRFNGDKKWYWLNVAELYTLVGDNENAERCFEKLAKDDPKFIPEYIKTLARNGNDELALKKTEFFLQKTKTEELLVLKRDLLVVNEKENEAIELTKELISIDPANEAYYFDISELLMSKKDYDEAKKYIDEGLEILHDNPVLVRQSFKLLMEQEKFDQAFVLLNNAFVNDRLDFNEKIGFVVDFIESDKEHKKTKELIKSLDNWAEETEDLRIYPIIGNLYKVERRDDLALEYFRKGFNKGYAEFSVLIEMLLIEQELGKFDLLLVDSNKMLELFPSHPVLYLFRGFAASQEGQFDYAIESFETGLIYVVNNDKLKGEFYGQMANAYYSNGDLDESFKQYEKALKFDPENVLILNNYAYFLAVNNRDLDRALELINQVVEHEANNPTYLDTLAWIYFKRGEYDNAKSVMEDALRYGKVASAEMLEHYGDILFKLDEVKSAVKNWKKAQKLAGNNSSSDLQRKIESKSLVD